MPPRPADSAQPPRPTAAPAGRWDAIAETGLAGTGLVAFAAACHGDTGFPLAGLPGLALAALCLGRALVSADSAAGLLGLRLRGARHGRAWCLGGLLLGTLLALWYRTHLGTGILPLGLKPFAGVALLIGAAEELVYRGYAQGRLRAVGPVAAVLVAAGLHTAYKGALFAFPPAPELRFDLVTVTAFTFAAGALFGVARERAGSVWPSLVAHAAFDLLVCGDAARAPWWVWH